MSYIPYPAYYDDAPIDLRHVYASERPAGKHGFLRCVGDHFEFEDGTLGRFWGTNFNGGSCFPDRKHAENVALRLAKIGVNIVRFHQLDAEWDTPNIYNFTKGPRCGVTTELDDESMDALDYFCYCLKQQGIYLYMDVFTYRRFKTDEGVVNAHLLPDAAKPYFAYNRRLIELQKKQAYDIFNHYNPYTGMKYKDDPAFVMCEVVNEADVFWFPVEVEPYLTEYRELFKSWLKSHGIEYAKDVDTCDMNDKSCETLNAFRSDVMVSYYREMLDYMRDFGVKIPLCTTNLSGQDMRLKTYLEGDFTDSHTYLYDWMWGEHRCRNVAMTSLVDPKLENLSAMRTFDRPFFVSEWDMPWPNEFRAESPILYAAVGSMQNWAGFAIHTYAYSNRLERMNMLGKETTAESIGGVAFREGVFSTWNDPAKFGLFYHAALITRRGDVSCDGPKVGIKGYGSAFIGASEKCRIANQIDGTSGEDVLVPSNHVIVDRSSGEVSSDNGQLYRSWKDGYGTVDSPRTKCAYGFLAKNGVRRLDGLTIDCATDFAVIALSSLTDESLFETSSILLTAVGRAQNTDAGFDGDKMLEYGHAPILAELIEAEITLKTSRPNLAVWAVNAEGFYIGREPVTYENGELKFKIGNLHKSIYYVIQAE